MDEARRIQLWNKIQRMKADLDLLGGYVQNEGCLPRTPEDKTEAHQRASALLNDITVYIKEVTGQ